MGKQLKFLFLATLTTLMVVAGSILQVGEPLMAAPFTGVNGQGGQGAIALANQLYTQYPDIPRASATNTTLLSRFIDYHLDTQARPAQYHLDWELSMADYLDAAYTNKTQRSELNAGVSLSDKQAMQALSRHQRHDLVRSLEHHFAQ